MNWKEIVHVLIFSSFDENFFSVHFQLNKDRRKSDDIVSITNDLSVAIISTISSNSISFCNMNLFVSFSKRQRYRPLLSIRISRFSKDIVEAFQNFLSTRACETYVSINNKLETIAEIYICKRPCRLRNTRRMQLWINYLV